MALPPSYDVDRLASYGWDDLVQQLHTGAFPDLLDDGSQLLIGLFKVTFLEKEHQQSSNCVYDEHGSELCLVALRHLLF